VAAHVLRDLITREMPNALIQQPGRGGRHRLELVAILGGWTAFGLLTASQRYLLFWMQGRPIPAGEALIGALTEAWIWALATIIIFWLARRYPPVRGRLVHHAAAHAVAAIALSVARGALMVGIARWSPLFSERTFRDQFLMHFNQYFLFYWLLLGIAWAVYYYARFRERELEAERLAAGLIEARLQALKMQLHPHFLFNTLNAISALVPPEAQPARRMVARLGDLLRIALDHEATQEVTLAEELEFLEPYAEIERTRLGDRLALEVAVEPEALTARVPHLVLQPLVENAIRHGIAPRAAPGRVRIEGRVEAKSLVLTVTNTGHTARAAGYAADGGEASHPDGGGLGLPNIRSRLEQLYGADHRFRSGPAGGGEWVSEIRIPFRATDSTAGSGAAPG
jgi:two-component system, LytTR family, sensor kinase